MVKWDDRQKRRARVILQHSLFSLESNVVLRPGDLVEGMFYGCRHQPHAGRQQTRKCYSGIFSIMWRSKVNSLPPVTSLASTTASLGTCIREIKVGIQERGGHGILPKRVRRLFCMHIVHVNGTSHCTMLGNVGMHGNDGIPHA